MHDGVRVYETALHSDQIREAFLNSDDKRFSVKWNSRKSRFTVNCKTNMAAFVGTCVRVRGDVHSLDGITVVQVRPAPPVSIPIGIIYVVLTGLILFYTGQKMYIPIGEIVAMLCVVTALAFGALYLTSRFTSTAVDLYADAVYWLERRLELKEMK